MRYITTTLLILSTFNSFSQNGRVQFEKCYNELKEAKSIFLNGAFNGFGENEGKVIKTAGTIALQKDGLNITRYKSMAVAEVALLEKIKFEQVSYNGVDVYSYNNDKGEYENKGNWEPDGKNYSGFSKLLYGNLLAAFDEFEKYKEDISITSDGNGYVFELQSTLVRGRLVMHVNYGNLTPVSIIRYNEKDNEKDYVYLTLTNVQYNVSFPLNYFEPSSSLLDQNNNSKIESLPEKGSNSILLKNGVKAPEWELVNSNGDRKKLSDFKGKIVVLDFWATWCAPCIQAQPLLQSIHEKYRDVVVLGMDFNDKTGIDINAYKEKMQINYEMILNAEAIADLYKINALPTVYVIDKLGYIIYSSLGYNEKESQELILIIENEIK